MTKENKKAIKKKKEEKKKRKKKEHPEKPAGNRKRRRDASPSPVKPSFEGQRNLRGHSGKAKEFHQSPAKKSKYRPQRNEPVHHSPKKSVSST